MHAVLAHDDAHPPTPAVKLPPWDLTRISLTKGGAIPALPTGQIDLFVLLADARTGISDSMIAAWNFYQERQFPRILIVQGIEETTTDFDDIVLIANRTLEPVATPFLVLHDEEGKPSGLIALETGTVIDYSNAAAEMRDADHELLELVRDFQEEHRQNFQDLGSGAFAAGVVAVAIPIAARNNLGVAELTRYLLLLARR